MAVPTAHSTLLYTLGRGIVSIGEWSGATPPAGGAYYDVGNSPAFSVEVTEETLEHFSYRSGTRTKDKEVSLETGYTVSFQLDEPSVKNMKNFLKATLTGENVLNANQNLNQEFALKFVSDNPSGPNQKWEFWRCKLSPYGALSLIADEWLVMSFTAEGLADTDNHPTSQHFSVTFATTTTTTTTST